MYTQTSTTTEDRRVMGGANPIAMGGASTTAVGGASTTAVGEASTTAVGGANTALNLAIVSQQSFPISTNHSVMFAFEAKL